MKRPLRLVLNTPRNTRMTAGRLARRIFDGDVDDLQEARLLLDYIKVVQAGFKQETEAAVQTRLEQLEDRLASLGRRTQERGIVDAQPTT